MLSPEELDDLNDQARALVLDMPEFARQQLAQNAILVTLVRARTLAHRGYRQRVDDLLASAAPSYSYELGRMTSRTQRMIQNLRSTR